MGRLKELGIPGIPYKSAFDDTRFSDHQPRAILPASSDSLPSIEDWLEKTLSPTPTSTSSTSIQALAETSGTSDHSQRGTSQTQKKRKRSRSSSPDRTPHLPLTKQVLMSYLEGMGPANRGLATPQGSEDHPIVDWNDRTPSKSSSTSNTLLESDVRFYMEQHNMYLMQGKLDEPLFSDFKTKVAAVIEVERGSTMKPSSVKKVHNKANAAMFNNEDTLLSNVLPGIIKEKRSITHEDPNNPGETITTIEDFEDTGLGVTQNREFRRNCLPNAYSALGHDDRIARNLAKKEGVLNPKPDRVYGVVRERHPVPRGMKIRTGTHELLEIVSNLIFGFFIIEGKSSSGSMTTAALQALRGTTALVYSQRTVLISTKQLAADGGAIGVDDQTFVYSCTMDGNVMKFFVTFACVEDSNGTKVTSYYMEHLATEAYLSSDDAPARLRKICHNILDWGVRTRHATLEERCAAVYAYDDNLIKQEALKKPGQQSERSPSKRQKTGGVGTSRAASSTGKDLGALVREVD